MHVDCVAGVVDAVSLLFVCFAGIKSRGEKHFFKTLSIKHLLSSNLKAFSV